MKSEVSIRLYCPTLRFILDENEEGGEPLNLNGPIAKEKERERIWKFPIKK